MSYARLSKHSDVYLYADTNGGFTCCYCPLHPESQRSLTLHAMLAHLDEHEAAGHHCGVFTPDDVTWNEIRAEMTENWNAGWDHEANQWKDD